MNGDGIMSIFDEEFQIENKSLEKYNGNDSVVFVPCGTEFISTDSFLNNLHLQEIRLPEGIRIIHDSAFEGCKNLKRVYLPATLEHIGRGAFMDCSMLEEIVIPKKVMLVGGLAFDGCTSLKKIKVLGMDTSFSRHDAFGNCPVLREIEVPACFPCDIRETLMAHLGKKVKIIENDDII